MSLSTVESRLRLWADSASLKASYLNDPDSIAAMDKAAREFRALMAAVQAAAAELAATREQLAAMPVPKAPKVRGVAGISAIEFWSRHGQAVQAIIAVYGTRWKLVAPAGETILATVPAGWRSAKTGVLREDGGNAVRWRKDGRMPAAHYWPEQRLPIALEITPDYPRAYVWTGYGPPEAGDKPHSDAWHKTHGYVWDGLTPAWRFEIEVRNQWNRDDAIAAEHEAKRLASLEDEPELMAAE